MIFEGMSETGF